MISAYFDVAVPVQIEENGRVVGWTIANEQIHRKRNQQLNNVQFIVTSLT